MADGEGSPCLRQYDALCTKMDMGFTREEERIINWALLQVTEKKFILFYTS